MYTISLLAISVDVASVRELSSLLQLNPVLSLIGHGTLGKSL